MVATTLRQEILYLAMELSNSKWNFFLAMVKRFVASLGQAEVIQPTHQIGMAAGSLP
jgi:hypothetical protein